jgi:hypothetical protein
VHFSLVLWHIIFETTAQIPEVEFEGKYGYLRANTDLWGQIINEISQSLVYISQTFSNVIVWYLFVTRLETTLFASYAKATLFRIYFRNLSVQRSFLQYKTSSFLVLWDHCTDTGSWIRGKIRIYEDKYTTLTFSYYWTCKSEHIATKYVIHFIIAIFHLMFKKRWCIKICIKSYFNQINTFQHIGIKFK